MQSEISFAKILKPTAEEFNDFSGYLDKAEKANPGYGLFKVIPPKKWRPCKIDYPTNINDLIVSHPIEQNVYGKGGIYELLLIQRKSMKVQDYKKKVESFESLTENKSIESVEEMFWRNVAFSPPLYGADIKGSLFDDNIPWDLKNLPGLLSDGLRKKISGVNEPYLYFGSWKTMFAWHKEDMDLYSINYLHYGKPKFWYSLPREESYKLESFAKQQFPEAFSKCKEYLRHKTIVISPYILKQKFPDLKIHKMVQNPGEFIITIGGAYHTGFNWGFNLAEAVNFALPRWLDILPTVRACQCASDSVKIDKSEFLKNLGTQKRKSISKKSDIEEVEDINTHKCDEKSSSSTKLPSRSTDVYSILALPSKKKTEMVKIEKSPRKSPCQIKKIGKTDSDHFRRKRIYEARNSQEKKEKEKKDDKDNEGGGKLLKYSKKIKKASFSPKINHSRKSSIDSFCEGKTQRKFSKISDDEDLSVENVCQSDDSVKVRKFSDENIWKRLEDITKSR